jgi:hypothetical protein
MTQSQQPKPSKPSDKDLRDNPGIGQTAGTDNFENTFDDEEGENTVEGDVLNDTTPQGGIDPNQRGRTNK